MNHDLESKIARLNEKATKEIIEGFSFSPEWALGELQPKCQSPIEQLMLEAILLFFHKRKICNEGLTLGNSMYLPRLTEYAEMDLKIVGESNFIDLQVPIDGYHADFVIQRVEHCGPDLWAKTPSVVIECDGHDFHERTKEQAQKDKLRDRLMQQKGYAVLRFTGSEIWRDAWACASQINEFLEGKIEESMRQIGQ